MNASTPGGPGPFRLCAEVLGPMPIIDAYLSRLQVPDLLGAFVPGDHRMKDLCRMIRR
ncbi:MAG: hypothetical protein ACYDEP_13380 [Acidimicrobiales bacterium]